MLLYFSICLCIFVLSIVHDNSKEYLLKKISLFFIITLCSIMPVFRDINVGTDTKTYIDMFLNSDSKILLSQGIEPFFTFIIYILKELGFSDYRYYLFIFYIIFISVFIYSAKGIFGKITLPLIAFLTISTIYFSHFNVIRQSIAISFFMMNIMYFLKDNKKGLFISLIVSIMFHYSAIVNLFFFLCVYLYKKSKILMIFLFLLLFFCILFSNNIFEYIGSYLPFLRISGYLGKIEENPSGLKIYIFSIFLMLFYFFLKNKFKLHSRMYDLISILFIFLCIFNFAILFLNLPIEGPGRVVYYYYLAYVFLYYVFSRFFSGVQEFFIANLVFIFSLIYMFFLYSIGNMHGIFPYSFY